MSRSLKCVLVVCGLLCIPELALGQPPTGTWKVNGNGHEGELVIKSVAGLKVEGTIYGQPFVGAYDEKTMRLNFLRIQDPKDPTTSQAWKGYLFQNVGETEVKYTLAGTFESFGEGGGAPRLEFGWFAQITKPKE
ncbi:MAG TPA: hypothetical protein VKE40_23965 [Gemmataceae bacterium]|nr:hypothetical protein [Gemmataceae bacterium]